MNHFPRRSWNRTSSQGYSISDDCRPTKWILQYAPEMETPEGSGRWIIDELIDEATLDGQPLTDEEIKLLSTQMWDLTDDMRPMGLSLNNRLVPSVRRRIERSKASGGPTTKVRRGLVLPVDWDEHYMRVYSTQLPWFISGIMQNAMLNNAMAGEKKPWKSK